jgi:TonB-dependent starch-binding outer membrane protein SusC
MKMMSLIERPSDFPLQLMGNIEKHPCGMLRLVLKITLLFVLLSGTAFHLLAQKEVNGFVSSKEDGMPLPGVNVVLKGTNTGTTTDSNGMFKLNLPLDDGVLIFSFIGFKTHEAALSDESPLYIHLASDVSQLSEIVVTGTGVPIEKRKLAFAVESLDSKDFPVVPTASIDQALVGKIPGAQIASINGTPGAEISILLRGINTINRGTMPMILVDGVQMVATTLSAIDPNTIERVEVIQGAAAATIYGAQGANGVIQIFTKRGQHGKLRIDLSSSIANNAFLNTGNLRKARLHGFQTNDNSEVINPATGEPLQQSPVTLLFDGNVGYDPLNPASQFDKPYNRNLQYYDHFDMFLQPANIYSNSLVLSGGMESMDYSIAVSNMHHQSNFRGDGYNDRTNLISNLGFELAKGLRLRSITQLVYTKNTINIWGKPELGASYNTFGLFNAQPFANYELKDEDGNYGAHFGLAAGINQFNPFYELQYGNTSENKVDIIQNILLNYAITKNFELEALYGINHQNRDIKHVVLNQSLNQNSNAIDVWTAWRNWQDNTGEIATFFNDRTFQNFKVSANIHFDFSSDFNWNFPLRTITQLVYDYRSDHLTRFSTTAMGMPLTQPITASRGSRYNTYEDYKEEFVTFGYLLNQRIEFGELAGISAGFRTDYSSAFGEGSRPFTFPRADGYYRISGMNFWDASKIANLILEWKLRAAYGEAGIQPLPFDRYVTLSPRTIGTSNTLFFGTNQSNPDLDVEVSRELEIGTDITLNGLRGAWLRNFQLTLSYWSRKNDNIIFLIDAPPSVGFGRVIDNALSIESNGIQTSLSSVIYKGRKLLWNMTTHFSKQESLITKVKGDRILRMDKVMEAGQSVGEFFGHFMIRSLDQKKPDGSPFIDNDMQNQYEVASNGWVVNKLTKQPFISADLYPMGDPNPDFMMTFMHDFTYKKFLTFAFQFDWVYGMQLHNGTKKWMYRDGIHADYEKPITINEETGAWSAFYRGVYNPIFWDKNYFVEDASFLRLRNISLGCDLVPLLHPKSLSRLQLIFSGRNIWTRTNYSGLDPEISTFGTMPNSLWRGLDNNSLPNFRSYQITLNIGL